METELRTPDGVILAPFPGLRPFQPNEELIFRGRQAHTYELLRRLSSRRFLAVVGVSGSGKSSLVRAGLLPALHRGYLAEATSRWRIAVMRPGRTPLANLATALNKDDVLGHVEESGLRHSSLGLVEAVQQASLATGESLLVVVDQFEELFRHQRHSPRNDRGADATHFVNLLLTSTARPDVSVYVVLTMRSDFLGDCAQFAGLPQALTDSQFLIPRLTRVERKQAIEEPLRLFKAEMTPQLVEQLLNDSAREADEGSGDSRSPGASPDPLPVLQHALLRTYGIWSSIPHDKRQPQIDLTDYRDAGRMNTAIERHAEAIYNEKLDDAERQWAERVFRCVTTMELGRPTRRPTSLKDVYAIVGAKDADRTAIEYVLGLFSDPDTSFLDITTEETSESDDRRPNRIIDLTHESVIWKWSRLGDWVKKEAASGDLYRDLAKDSLTGTHWTEPKLSMARAQERSQWNAEWARQYSDEDFGKATALLDSSERAIRNERRNKTIIGVVLVALAVAVSLFLYERRIVEQQSEVIAALNQHDKEIASQLASAESDKTRLSTELAQGNLTQHQRDDLSAQLAAANKRADDLQAEKAAVQNQLQQANSGQVSIQTLTTSLNDTLNNLRDETNKRKAAEAKRDEYKKFIDDHPVMSATPAPTPTATTTPTVTPTTTPAPAKREPFADEMMAFGDFVARYEAAFRTSRAQRKQAILALWSNPKTARLPSDIEDLATGCGAPGFTIAEDPASQSRLESVGADTRRTTVRELVTCPDFSTKATWTAALTLNYDRTNPQRPVFLIASEVITKK